MTDAEVAAEMGRSRVSIWRLRTSAIAAMTGALGIDGPDDRAALMDAIGWRDAPDPVESPDYLDDDYEVPPEYIFPVTVRAA